MRSHRYAVLLAATALATVTRPSLAQSAGDGFLFHTPGVSWELFGGFDRATASSDVFASVTKQLTLNPGDFSTATFATNFPIRLSPTNHILCNPSFSNVP